MKKINFKELFKKNWIHFLALALFFLGTFIYFQPQFSGHGLKQHDIEQFRGMANEINHYRETVGGEPLWTNSMFGGMPSYQISTKYDGNILGKISNLFYLWMSSPAGLFFAYLVGFYIMLLCFKIDPKIAILGAFAYAFSSYFIIILQAGHETKAIAIAFAPPVIGAFYMAYKRNLKWGLLLSALFMTLELYANHVQITYYLLIVLVFLGIGMLIEQIREKQIVHFSKATLGLIVVYLFAAGVNYGRLALTNDYAKYTIRGGNDITIHTDGTSNADNSTSGLDKDYVTQWSYGISESLTLISPNIKGAKSSSLANSEFSYLLKDSEHRKTARLVSENNVYWGDQPFTSGPVYLGIIVFFLALLGMVYLKGAMKWALLGATLLTLMLSWGKNFMGLTDFFLDNVPFYNKFRAVTIILAMVELIIPLLGVLFLNELYKNREEIKKKAMPFFATTGALLVVLITLTFVGLGDGYLSQAENDFIADYPEQIELQLANEDPQVLLDNGIDINNPIHIKQIVDRQLEIVDQQFGALVEIRSTIYQSSMIRSLLFLALAAGLLALFFKTNIKSEFLIGGLAVLIIIDLVGVDVNYLNSKKSNSRTYDYWVERQKVDFPFAPTEADKQILEMETEANPDLRKLVDAIKTESKGNSNATWSKRFQTLGSATNYRVFEPSLGFNSSRASYFHKALNGYHGAKLRRIQNVKDFHIDYSNMQVLNMLNVKYFIQNNSASQNPGALGPVWLVKEVNIQPNPDQELLALGNLFVIENHSSEKLFINAKEAKADTITGRERIALGDNSAETFDITPAVRSGINASYVVDINGEENWIPSSELAKDSLNSFTPILSVHLVHEFDPKNEVIIGDDIASQLTSLTFDGQGTIEMTSYQPNELVYSFDNTGTQFGVFSEMYYPDGWNAYIDGKQVDIFRVNYLLRGIELPDGKHELVMKFEVPKYKTSNTLALACSILLILAMGGFFVKDFLLEDKKDKAA